MATLICLGSRTPLSDFAMFFRQRKTMSNRGNVCHFPKQVKQIDGDVHVMVTTPIDFGNSFCNFQSLNPTFVVRARVPPAAFLHVDYEVRHYSTVGLFFVYKKQTLDDYVLDKRTTKTS